MRFHNTRKQFSPLIGFDFDGEALCEIFYSGKNNNDIFESDNNGH